MAITVQKWGNSQGIRIPKAILDSVGWKSDDELVAQAYGNTIVIKPKHSITLESLFDGYEGNYDEGEIDWGDSVGGEIW